MTTIINQHKLTSSQFNSTSLTIVRHNLKRSNALRIKSDNFEPLPSSLRESLQAIRKSQLIADGQQREDEQEAEAELSLLEQIKRGVRLKPVGERTTVAKRSNADAEEESVSEILIRVLRQRYVAMQRTDDEEEDEEENEVEAEISPSYDYEKGQFGSRNSFESEQKVSSNLYLVNYNKDKKRKQLTCVLYAGESIRSTVKQRTLLEQLGEYSTIKIRAISSEFLTNDLVGDSFKMSQHTQTDGVQFRITQTKSKENRKDRYHVLPNEIEEKQEPTKWDGPFHFIQAADTQYGMIDSYIKKIEPIRWDGEIRLSELLIEKCNNMKPKPKFMVVCGDLTDAEPASELRREQVYDFKRIFAKLDSSIPLVCVCGNHDVGNEPTMDTLLGYQADFGDDYFYFITGGILFIVINSQFYQHRANVEEYARQQDEWLMDILKKCKQFKYSIVFEHIPWFLSKYDEEDEYFNITLKTRLAWLERFHEAGVTKIMCGHYHRNAGGWYKSMELVVTSAVGAQCGNDKSGARIVRVLSESIEHQYYALEDLPEQIDLKNVSNKDSDEPATWYSKCCIN